MKIVIFLLHFFLATGLFAVCTQKATGLLLCIPRTGDRGDIWFNDMQQTFIKVNDNAVSTTTAAGYGVLAATQTWTGLNTYTKHLVGSSITATEFYGGGFNLTNISSMAISGFYSNDNVRSNLGLAIGTDVLAPDGDGSNLTGIFDSPLIIQSTATGNYLLRVATATYLATAPGDCAAGQYVSGLAADGTLTCGTPSGAGDVVLAATQTFTGLNTFSKQTSLNQVIVTSTSYNTISFGGTTLATWYKLPSWSMTISTPGVYDISLWTHLYATLATGTEKFAGTDVCLSTSTVAGTGLFTCTVGILPTNPGYGTYFLQPIILKTRYTVAAALTIYIHGKVINWSGTPTVTAFSIYNGSDFHSSLPNGDGEIRAELVRY